MPAGEVQTTLESCIDRSNIPTRFGGDFEYEPGMPTKADSAIRQRLKWSKPHDEVPRGPLKWTDDGKGVSAIEAIGRIRGQERRERIAVLRTGGKKSRKSS